MKKQGFTLAELLGVIVIISLLLLLIIPLIINGVKNKEADVAEANNTIIFEAVGEYLDLDKEKYPNTPGNVYCISLKELIDTGKLVDPVKKIVEEGNYDVDDYTIEVRISNNGVRKYTALKKNECNNHISKNIEIVVNPANNKWSTQKTVTIYYPNLGDGYIHEYRINDGAWQTTPNRELELTFDTDGKVEARMTGKSEINKIAKVEKIDIEDPKVLQVALGDWDMNYHQRVDLTLTDSQSGVGGYCITTNPQKPKADDECFQTVRFPAYGGTGTVTEFLPEGTYYIFAKDRVNRVGGYNSDNPNDPNNKDLTFIVKDDVAPTCEITLNGKIGDNNWYVSDVDVKLTNTDDHSGIRSYDLTTSTNPTYNHLTDNITSSETAKNVIFNKTHDTDILNVKYYGYVEDRAGNKSECQSINFKRDATKPKIDITTNMESTDNLTINLSDKTSGLIGYNVTTAKGIPTTWTSITGQEGTITLTKTNGIYYIYAKDQAGNINSNGDGTEVYVECSVTKVSSSSCSVTCGGGTLTKTYKDSRTSKVCSTSKQSCNTHACYPDTGGSCTLGGTTLHSHSGFTAHCQGSSHTAYSFYYVYSGNGNSLSRCSWYLCGTHNHAWGDIISGMSWISD